MHDDLPDGLVRSSAATEAAGGDGRDFPIKIRAEAMR
jgi:hypothetical protein